MSETLVTELIEDAEARQGARRLAVEEFGPPRTIVGAGTALLLAVVGGVAALEILSTMVGYPLRPVPVDRANAVLREVTWGDWRVLAAAAALALAGIGLLAAALPGRLRVIPLHGADPGLAGGLSRAELQRLLADAALGVPGIERARVRLRDRFRGRVVIRAATRYRNPGNLAELVRIAAAGRLEHLELMRPPRVEVRLTWRKD